MNLGRILLFGHGLLFLVYGLVCFASPGLPAGYAGFDLATASGTVEVMAMYGGLQAAFGALLLMGGFRADQRVAGLRALAIVLGGLATARALGLLLHGPSEYNIGALMYESSASLLALWALRSESSTAAGD